MATLRQAALPIEYLETYLSDLERWLRVLRIANNASRSYAMLFAMAGRRIQKPRQIQLLAQKIQWLDNGLHFGVNLDTRITCSIQRSGKTVTGSAGTSPKQNKIISTSGMVFCWISCPSVPWRTTRAWPEVPPLVPISRKVLSCSQVF